jgi:hypothetical protein
MHLTMNKTKTAAVITIAFLMASVALMAMPVQTIQSVQAQLVGAIGTSPSDLYGYPNLGPLPAGVTPAYTFATFAYMSVTPNPVGVNQTVLVNVWTTPGLPNYFYRQGYTVTIQKPDGTTDVIGPFHSYLADCTAWFQYKVNQVGTWKFKFEHAGTYIPAGSYYARPGIYPPPYDNLTLGASIYYGPSSTDWQELTVQNQMVYSWPPAPFPTDYWTRPANSMNREWYPILGNFPWTGVYYYPDGTAAYATSEYHYTAYVQAPNTAHIVWRRQGSDSGLIGGQQYQQSLATGGGNPTIIYNGRCYQTVTKEVDGKPTSVWECYNLRTGQVYWDLTGITAPPTNIIYELPASSPLLSIAPTEASTRPKVYLVAVAGERFYKYDPWTGAVVLNVSIPAGMPDMSSFAAFTSGSVVYNNFWCLSAQTLPDGTFRLINWSMAGSSTDFSTRIGSNITWNKYMIITDDLTPTVGAIDFNAGISADTYWSIAAPRGYLAYWDRGAASYSIGYNVTAVDLKTGNVLFHIAANDTSLNMQANNVMVSAHGKVAAGIDGRRWAAWDLRTGKLAWTSELTAYPWGSWWPYYTASYDFNETKGAIIAGTYEGIYAIDWDNGKILWHYTDPNAVPFEQPYGATPFFSSMQIADGKIYAYNTEHTPTEPISRDWKLHCINATTGELIWKISGSMVPGAVADGYLTASNVFDGYTYVFGKGKSQTTVTAPQTAVPVGTSVVIQGTVMDMSPGDQGSTLNPTAPLDSPTALGTVPCVSAASMETQMEYLYMQQPIDGIWHNETITGVPVILTAIGSDNTVYDLGTVTTNGYYGTFSMAWTPPKADTYTITATFAGDDSYGSSTAATAVSVSPAPSATPTPTPPAAQPATDYTPYIIGMGIAIIIAVAIVGLLLYRKRA